MRGALGSCRLSQDETPPPSPPPHPKRPPQEAPAIVYVRAETSLERSPIRFPSVYPSSAPPLSRGDMLHHPNLGIYICCRDGGRGHALYPQQRHHYPPPKLVCISEAPLTLNREAAQYPYTYTQLPKSLYAPQLQSTVHAYCDRPK